MLKAEKSILRIIYIVTLLMFLMIGLNENKVSYIPLLMGGASCVLIAYGYFVIRRFYPQGDKYLFIIAAFIAQFGMVIIYRLDVSRLDQKEINTAHLWNLLSFKQLSWFILGIAVYVLILVLVPNLKKLEKLKYTYIVVAILLLASALILGREVKGSRNWIYIGGFSIQPSEIAKFLLVFYLGRTAKEMKGIKNILMKGFPVLLAIGLLVLQKDLGAALIFFGVFITMLFIATSNFKDVLLGFVCFAGAGTASYYFFSHVRKRIDIWFDLWKYFILNIKPETAAIKEKVLYLKTDKAYQVVQSLISISAGSLFGTGIGLGHPELIPEAHNDFIFAAICEEMGLLGAIALLFFFLLLVYRGLRCSIYAKDDFSRLVAVGLSSTFAFQVFVIIGGVTNMIPLTGITLPFVSYGGSSMIISFASLAILQKISETGCDRNAK